AAGVFRQGDRERRTRSDRRCRADWRQGAVGVAYAEPDDVTAEVGLPLGPRNDRVAARVDRYRSGWLTGLGGQHHGLAERTAGAAKARKDRASRACLCQAAREHDRRVAAII